MKINSKKSLEISIEILSFLKKERFGIMEELSLHQKHNFVKSIYELFDPKLKGDFTKELSKYDNLEVGEQLMSIFDNENFHSPNIPSSSPSFFREGEVSEPDNSYEDFYIRICTEIKEIFSKHISKFSNGSTLTKFNLIICFIILSNFSFGQNWIQQNSNTSQHLKGCFFVNENKGWAVGDNGTILYTSNGGTTWQAQNSGTLNLPTL